MLFYFLVWAPIGLAALSEKQRWSTSTAIAICVLFTLIIGLRIEVGADWVNYLPKVDEQIGAPLAYPLSMTEPGYAMANWISARLNTDIFGVNLICAGLFSVGLVCYCRRRPYPWLALALGFPYLAVVVAMGYSRQGVAIGLELLALLALERDRLLPFLGWIALAATFHMTALIVLVLPVATIKRDLGRFNGLIRLLLLLGASYGLFEVFLSSSIEGYRTNYIDAEYQSQGALVRVFMCLLPALIFLLKRRQFVISEVQDSIYTLMSLMAMAASIGLVLSPSSTAVDRVALYLIPLQIFVGSHLPATGCFGLGPKAWRRFLVFLSLSVLGVWLVFAAFSFAWIPYRNLLFEL